MKKIICKVEYDTEASTPVAKFAEGQFGDPAGYEETLYVTEDGKYFLQRKEREKKKKILRASGEEEELFTTEPRELKWLDEGDHININKQIYYRFTYINPENA